MVNKSDVCAVGDEDGVDSCNDVDQGSADECGYNRRRSVSG